MEFIDGKTVAPTYLVLYRVSASAFDLKFLVQHRNWFFRFPKVHLHPFVVFSGGEYAKNPLPVGDFSSFVPRVIRLLWLKNKLDPLVWGFFFLFLWAIDLQKTSSSCFFLKKFIDFFHKARKVERCFGKI